MRRVLVSWLFVLVATVTTITGWRTAEYDFWDGLAGVNLPAPP